MARAFTPGLTVVRATRLRKERRLPIPGEVVVNVGDVVKARDVVARTHLPGNIIPINAAGKLGVQPQDLAELTLVKPGDEVKKGQLLARSKGIFGLFRQSLVAPADGAIDTISSITGQMILREPPVPLEVIAYVDGKVVERVGDEGVVVETDCSFAQGIFGIGGETIGPLKVIVGSPSDEVTGELVTSECEGKILVGGSFATAQALEQARAVGAAAVVVGGIDDRNLRTFLGYDIGVAITGTEDIGLTLILTEGFGRLAMQSRTFELLKECEEMQASVNGTTQIRAGVMRPEVIIPRTGIELSREESVTQTGLMEVGSPVRIIREPYFGGLAKVTSLPSELQEIETGALIRVVELELDPDRKRVTIPRANVELLEP